MLSVLIPIFIARAFLFGNEVEKNLILLFRKALTTVSTDVLLHRLEAISKLPISNEACQTKAICIQAENDNLIPPDSVDRFKDLFDNIEVHKVVGPHFLMQSNPEACVEIVTSAYTS